MRVIRIFIPLEIKNKKDLVVCDKEIIHRLKNVLRLKSGDNINIFNSKDGEFACKINLISNEKIILNVFEKKEKENLEPKIKINLFQAIIKKDKFDFVVEKTTEVGVNSITPLITEYTIKTNLNLKRLRKIAIESAEQSGRILIPEINEKIDFFKLLESYKINEKNSFLFDPQGEPLVNYAQNLKEVDEVNIFIGPEGGFSNKEIEMAKNKKIKIVSFGPRILKSETISPVVIGYILTTNI